MKYGDARVLLACPQHECKEYAFDRWLGAVGKVTYPFMDVMVVDNSDSGDFYDRWHSKVPMVRLPISGNANYRISTSMEFIRRYFLTRDYAWWWSLESDVIVPPYTLDFMMGNTANADWVSMPYPSRTQAATLDYSFGCALFSRHLMSLVDFTLAPDNITTDGWLKVAVEQRARIKVLRSAIVPKHLKE